MEYLDILKVATVHTYQEGDFIFQEGDDAREGMFFVLSGEVAACKMIGSKRELLNRVTKGNFFGEFALVLNTKRTAAVVALENNTKLVAINRDSFIKIIASNIKFIQTLINAARNRTRRFVNLINLITPPPKLITIPELESELGKTRLKNIEIGNLINSNQKRFFAANNIVFKEKEYGDNNFFLILEGKVRILKSKPKREEIEKDEELVFHMDSFMDIEKYLEIEEDEVEIGCWETGDIFGYHDINDSYVRNYTAIAGSGGARLAILNQEIFFKIARLNPELFYNAYKLFIIHLIIFQDTYLKTVRKKEPGE